MPQNRLLFLDGNRLAAYHWQRGKLLAEGEFIHDNAGIKAFALYLAGHDGSLFSILADVTEEGFQLEEIPYVGGKDRTSLLQRRLTQYFYGTPYTLATSLGREKTGRRDEKILFAALTQPRHFQPWLDAMRQSGAQLAGIYSAPVALASLLENKHATKGPQLVLSISRSGVRQTFFNDGKLHFSRLTVLATGAMEEAAIACAIEAKKIYQYLVGQRLVKRGAVLAVNVLVHPAQASAIQAHCKATAELNFVFIDLLEEAKRAKLNTPLPDSRCELLLLHQLIHRPPAHQFAPANERHFYRLWQLRFGLTAAALVFFSACLLYSGKLYVDSHRLNGRTTQLMNETSNDRSKYAVALDALPRIPIATEDMRALVNRFEELEARSPLLEAIYFPLSRALDATPGINIQRIDWKASAKPSDADAPAAIALKQAPLTVDGSYFAIADIDAQLPLAIANDHRAMLQTVNQLLAELGKDTTIRVQMTQMPFDVESGKTIKGSADASTTQADAPRLALRILRATQ